MAFTWIGWNEPQTYQYFFLAGGALILMLAFHIARRNASPLLFGRITRIKHGSGYLIVVPIHNIGYRHITFHAKIFLDGDAESLKTLDRYKAKDNSPVDFKLPAGDAKPLVIFEQSEEGTLSLPHRSGDLQIDPERQIFDILAKSDSRKAFARIYLSPFPGGLHLSDGFSGIDVEIKTKESAALIMARQTREMMIQTKGGN